MKKQIETYKIMVVVKRDDPKWSFHNYSFAATCHHYDDKVLQIWTEDDHVLFPVDCFDYFRVYDADKARKIMMNEY
jgi:hypothetical protein